MPRAPNDKVNKAHKLYQQGKKLVEIAEALELPPGTIRRWKSVYHWDGESDKRESERSDKNSERSLSSSQTGNSLRYEDESDAGQISGNRDLTEKQRLFCQYYVRCFNATKAYQKAYECKYETAMANGSELLRNTKVAKEISRLKQNKLNRLMLSEDDIFQKYIDIAFADMTDYVEWGRVRKPVMGPDGPVMEEDQETGELKPAMREVNEIRFKDSSLVDGSIVSEVKIGKDGASVRLADRMKAMQWLADRTDLLTAETRQRLDLEARKLEMHLAKLTGQIEICPDLPDSGAEEPQKD